MRWVAASGAIAIIACAGAHALNAGAKTFLWNASPSEPKGVYVKVSDPAKVGEIVAFMAPPPAFPYADHRLGYLHQVPVLKQLAAGEGMQVCTQNHVLKISGKVQATVRTTDNQGVALPRWDECRPLRAGEFFAFSNRVPNSFDSRYFGPIASRKIIAVYRPLWVDGRLKG
ncbi:MAG: S26 family signal peptidase [Caulobacteraceae bacterium]